MTSMVPEILNPALLKLQEYMGNFYPEMAKAGAFPLDFWKIEDDDLFWEAIGYLPLFMYDVWSTHYDELPEGFRLAYPIFSIEDDYFVNGWTALTNAGTWLLPHAVRAYNRIGMASEAAALQAALNSVERNPDDDEAAEAAYKSVPNVYADDERKMEALLSFFRRRSDLFYVGEGT